jgi:RHS repeat-associated protein
MEISGRPILFHMGQKNTHELSNVSIHSSFNPSGQDPIVHDDLTGADGWVSNTENIQSFRTVGMAVTVPTFFVGENGRRYYLDRFESTGGGQPGGGWTVFVDRGFAVHDAQQGNVSNEIVAVYIRDQQRPTPTSTPMATNTGGMGQGGVRWAAVPPEKYSGTQGLHSMPGVLMKSPLQFVTSNPPAGQIWRKYYLVGGQRLAMRVRQSGQQDQLHYLLTDHLGSTSVSYDAVTVQVTPQKYMPWGELRGNGNGLPTDYTFTGQKWEEEIELMNFKARFYDPALGRFLSADTIVPGGVQGLDRYAFVFNNPLRYIDPSGHNPACGPDGIYCGWGNRIGPMSRSELYDILVQEGGWALPGPGNINDREGRTTSSKMGVIDNYEKIRRRLFISCGFVCVDPTGKINDTVLMSLIIGGELSKASGANYNEALEALSNEYHAEIVPGNDSNIYCGENCSLDEQLSWLTDVEAWYRGVIYDKMTANPKFWQNYYSDAQSAAAGYCYGPSCNSWMWGDRLENDLTTDQEGVIYWSGFIVSAKAISNYPNMDWWIVYEVIFLDLINRPWINQ